jgi:hypothetical protein
MTWEIITNAVASLNNPVNGGNDDLPLTNQKAFLKL